MDINEIEVGDNVVKFKHYILYIGREVNHINSSVIKRSSDTPEIID